MPITATTTGARQRGRGGGGVDITASTLVELGTLLMIPDPPGGGGSGVFGALDDATLGGPNPDGELAGAREAADAERSALRDPGPEPPSEGPSWTRICFTIADTARGVAMGTPDAMAASSTASAKSEAVA